MDVLMAWKTQELRKINAMHSSQQLHTLADGSKILIHSEDEKWIGKLATFENFEPLPPGEYVLAISRDSSAGTIVVGREGIVKGVLSVSALEALQRKIKAIKTL